MRSRKPVRWKVGLVQMRSTEDAAANRETAERLAATAVSRGAALVAFPENFLYLRKEGSRVPVAEPLDGERVARLKRLAADLDAWILAGSVPESFPGSERIHNTSLLIDPAGTVVAIYRKIHLFDARIPGRVALTESRWVAAGDRAVVAPTPLGLFGLSICYDLRFPELYRRLARDGAQVLFVPAAFTAHTGRAHWIELLRARAIENQCWVVAPAQVGVHGPGRESFGHSAVIDPWGTIRARKRTGEGVVVAEIDLDAVRRVRKEMPCLEHARPELFRSRGAS